MSFTYLNLQGKLEHVTATAEDIDRQLQRLLQANPRIIPVTGRAAALGDELVLDYAGFSEGVQFPGGTAEKQTLTLGSGMFIPGFEEQLVGANIGDDVTVTVTFPTEYHARSWRARTPSSAVMFTRSVPMTATSWTTPSPRRSASARTWSRCARTWARLCRTTTTSGPSRSCAGQLMHQAAATVEEQPIDEELDRMVEAQMETLTAQLAQKGLTLEAYCQFTGSDEKKLPGGYAARRAGGFPHPEGGGKDCPAGEPDRHRRGDGRRHPAHLR